MNTEDCIRAILKNIGENPTREGLIETPARVAKAHKELFAGYKIDPKTILKPFDAEGYDDLVLVRNIEYYSCCEHHMLPFFGVAHVAYLPGKTITGLSKIPRLVHAFARRLQNQERLTTQIATTLMNELSPRGVAVQITGKHMCMCMRGVRSDASDTVTSYFSGDFKTDALLRDQFFAQVALP